MNILFFLSPKQDLMYVYDDFTSTAAFSPQCPTTSATTVSLSDTGQ